MDIAFWQQTLRRRDADPVATWNDDEVGALRDYNAQARVAEEALGRVDILGRRNALAVVAGQQAGLFLSPLYIVYKALGATLLARRLADLLDRPVAPVFWIASDDHDFEEIRHAHILHRDGHVETLTYPDDDRDVSDFEARSAFDIPIDTHSVGRLLDCVEQATHPTEFRDARLSAWRDAANESTDIEIFFARLMADTLGPWCPVLLPSRLMPLRRRAMPILQREIEEPGETSRRIVTRIERIEAQGGEAILHRRGNEANFFLYRDGVRGKVSLDDAGAFAVSHPVSGEPLDSLSSENMLRELKTQPEHFSPNVATRPVVQDVALPTIAQIVGPGEKAYLSMLDEVYAFFCVAPPARVARPRALLVEPRIARHLDKLSIGDKVLMREDPEALADAVRRAIAPSGAYQALDALDRRIAEAFDRAREEFGELADQPDVQSALDKTRKHVARSAGQMRERIEKAIDREQERSGDLEGKLLDALLPEGKPQERVLGPLAPFLVNHGPALIDYLARSLNVQSDALGILRLGNMLEGAKQ